MGKLYYLHLITNTVRTGNDYEINMKSKDIDIKNNYLKTYWQIILREVISRQLTGNDFEGNEQT